MEGRSNPILEAQGPVVSESKNRRQKSPEYKNPLGAMAETAFPMVTRGGGVIGDS